MRSVATSLRHHNTSATPRRSVGADEGQVGQVAHRQGRPHGVVRDSWLWAPSLELWRATKERQQCNVDEMSVSSHPAAGIASSLSGAPSPSITQACSPKCLTGVRPAEGKGCQREISCRGRPHLPILIQDWRSAISPIVSQCGPLKFCSSIFASHFWTGDGHTCFHLRQSRRASIQPAGTYPED